MPDRSSRGFRPALLLGRLLLGRLFLARETSARLSVAGLLFAGLVVSAPARRGAAQPAGEDASTQSVLVVTATDEGVWLHEDGRPVLFYQQQTKSLHGRYGRENYIHPFYSLDGEVLSEDFPADHLHHRGIYWAWHQLWVGQQRAGDPWVAQDFTAEVKSVAVRGRDERSVTLGVEAIWRSPLITDAADRPLPLVHEQTSIRVHRSSESLQLFDFEIALQALVADVKLGGSEDEKGYGGFSVRVRLPPDLKFTGTDGPVQPQVGAVEAGPWINLATDTWGLAILTHRTNPGFPHPWILRRQRSMQNAAYPGREPVAVPRDRPLVLRYRLVLHRGQLDREAIDRLEQQYQDG